MLDLDVVDGRRSGRGATDVEGPHRELRARLADGLGGDDADGLTDVDLVAARQVAAVAHGTDAVARLAGDGRTHHDLVDTQLLERSTIASSIMVPRNDAVLPSDVQDEHVAGHHAAQHALAQRLDDVAAFDERAVMSSPEVGAAVDAR